MGGAGKTPVSLKIGKLLIKAGYIPHFISKGYAGLIKKSTLVQSWHSATSVGDESILLSEVAPTWNGTDRINSSKLAKKEGADCLIMDDGFQNPTIQKDFSIIVINAAQEFGNKRVMPSGPLRESINRGLSRTNLVITVDQISNEIKQQSAHEIVKEKQVTAHEQIRHPCRRLGRHQRARQVADHRDIPLPQYGILPPDEVEPVRVVHQWHGGGQRKIRKRTNRQREQHPHPPTIRRGPRLGPCHHHDEGDKIEPVNERAGMGEANHRAEAQPRRTKEEREHHLVRQHVPTVRQLERPLLRAHPLALFVV